MVFTFPEIQTTRSFEEQKQKIIDEIKEFDKAKGIEKDREAVDILHACETFIRVYFKGREGLLDLIINETKKKNIDRGYYTKKCF